VTAAGGDPRVPLVAGVMHARKEMADVVSLDLALEKEAARLSFEPGQFAMLYAFGVGEAAISFSGDPQCFDRITHTIRAAGATSAALASLGPGGALGLRGPFGRGWPMEEAHGRDLVIMAGGLGLAPLRPAILAAMRPPRAVNRIFLIYGARSPDLILYRDEIAEWADRGVQVLTTVDAAAPSWTGDVGLVTALAPRASFDPGNAVAFICGPEVMMRFSADALVDLGLPASRIWLSLERNMKCATGHCGHCQFGADFVCKTGPVFRFDAIRPRLFVREI